MIWLISLALKLGIPQRFAKVAVIVALIAMLVVFLALGKCAYDRNLIKAHEARQEAEIAKADRKADAKAAEQRRVDDARLTTETAEIKEAVNEAGTDPAARRRAYYECIRLQQDARARHKPPADC